MRKQSKSARGARLTSLAVLCALFAAAWSSQAAEGFRVAYVREIRGTGDTAVTKPAAIAVHAGLVYVADLDHRVQVFTDDGRFVRRWGGPSTCGVRCLPGEGNGRLFLPSGIALDAAGRVYVVDLGGVSLPPRVQRFTADGAFVSAWEGVGLDRFYYPRDVAVDASGNVYVADWGKRRVLMLAGDGSLIQEWGASEFLPWGLAVDDARGRLYVAPQNGRRLDVFSIASGERLASWSQVPYLEKLAVDREGRIYGIYGSTVHVFSPDGEPIGQWGSYGLLPGQFSNTTGIAIDEAGLVSSTWRKRLTLPSGPKGQRWTSKSPYPTGSRPRAASPPRPGRGRAAAA